MRSSWGIRSRVALITLVVGCGGGQHATIPARHAIGRPVEAIWPGSGMPRRVQLGERDVIVQSGDTAIGLAQAAGFVPEADAIEVLRALNPRIDVFDIQPGTHVLVPVLAEARGNCHLLVDEPKKLALRAAIASALRASPDRNESATVAAIAARLTEIDERLGKRSLVTSSSFLDVVTLEASEFENLIPKAGDPLFKETLEDLARYLTAQTRSFFDQHKGDHPIPHDEIFVKIVTRRRSGTMLEDVNGYQIHYIFRIYYSDRGDGFDFPTPSPVEATITPGIYSVWASSRGLRLGLKKDLDLLTPPVGPIVLVIGDDP